MRTLILDDEPAIVGLLARACAREGHAVEPFTSPTAAIAHLEHTAVDLLLTDLNMPELDGAAVIREAVRLQPQIFTLMITGHAAEFPIASILASGAADVMFKPFHMNELRTRLALAERRLEILRRLYRERESLMDVSNQMIQGLQLEIAALTTVSAPVGQPARAPLFPRRR